MQTHRLAFLPEARWYTEALLRPQFLARWRGDDLAESWSNVDGVIGHFDIGTSGEGDLALRAASGKVITRTTTRIAIPGIVGSLTLGRWFGSARGI